MKLIVVRYLVLSFLFAFGRYLHAATYVVFLRAHGLNFMDSALVNIYFFVALFLFEIPTGVYADMFGRKKSFLVSAALESVGLFIYGLSDSFCGFGFAEVVLAIGSTFQSGAFQAWLVDSLKHEGFQGKLDAVFSREQKINQVASITAVIAGAVIADFDIAWPWFLGSLIMAAVFLLGLILMREDYFTPKKFELKSVFGLMNRNAKAGVRFGLKNKAVLFLLAVGTAQFLALASANMLWAPHFHRYFSGIKPLGLMAIALLALTGLGSQFAPWFNRKIGSERKSILWSQILIALPLSLSGFTGRFVPDFGFFMAHEVGRGMFRPIKDAYLHENIPSEERATLISFESLSHHLGGVLGLLGSGYLAQTHGVPASWLASGVFLGISALLLWKNR